MLVAPVLGDRVVDDRLELLLRERLGHELLEHVELVLLASAACSSRPAARNASAASTRFLRSRWSTCSSSLSCQRPLQLLLGRAQAATGSAAARRAASASRARIASVSSSSIRRDQAHAGIPVIFAAEDVPVQVEDRLAAAGPDVDDARGSPRARPRAPCRRRTRASRFASSAGNCADLAERVDVALREHEQVDVGAFGAMSRIATKPSAAWTWSPSRTSRQKRQSARDGTDDPLLA